MQPKKDLNNVQRKMLDQIYTEQFGKKEQAILATRAKEYDALQIKVLKKESLTPNLKKMLKCGEEYYKLLESNKSYLNENGLYVNDTVSKKPELTLSHSYSYNSSYNKHPQLTAHTEETQRISIMLGEKKKEMRARIYGSSVSYDEVEKEITEILKGVL